MFHTLSAAFVSNICGSEPVKHWKLLDNAHPENRLQPPHPAHQSKGTSL